MTAIHRRSSGALGIVAAAMLATGCRPPDDPGDEHGVVKLQFRFAENQPDDPFLDTAEIEVTLNYLEDLVKFFNDNPEYKIEGDVGGPAYDRLEDGGEGWMDRLCDDYTAAGDIPCSVISIKQELSLGNHLTVRYAIPDPSKINNGILRFGPIPTSETIMGSARVNLSSNNSVRGLNGSGGVAWNTSSFMGTPARVNQGGEIVIGAADP